MVEEGGKADYIRLRVFLAPTSEVVTHEAVGMWLTHIKRNIVSH